ncbi:hypothetical protein SLS53_007426 [Cytospora paraplurivora]|uniref:AMP-dependent synthetase/ligase domain-containing protein n=1 Tax=Cytospora paraplurivora TaxID=2898453 RepID=A0AAN9YCF3_9PEZI
MAAKGVPAYGRRLAPQVLDELATTDPERVYAAIPKTSDIKDGYRDVTMADLARCVHYTAKWIEEKFGRSNVFETITYIGLSDLKGIVTLLAAIKTGYKLLLGGFLFFMDYAILGNLTLVLGPPHVAPDATLLKEVALQQKLRAIMTVPAILEQLLHDPHGIDLVKVLDFIACAGAPLPGPVGDRIAEFVKLYIFIGSTETFPLPELVKSPRDWRYHEYNPSLEHEMRPYDISTGTFELVILADDTTKNNAPVYHNLPGENPFYTKDLFTKHPTKPNLYKYYGRRDDIIILANGEKVNPVPLEQHVQGEPDLKGALLIGSGRLQSALIIEPREALGETERVRLLERLWPRIEEANLHIPSPGRVLQGMVICASPDKPFVRTGKATIVRKLTEEAYIGEIEYLYSKSSGQGDLLIDLKASDEKLYEPVAISRFA